jgi:hypothetical protein
LGALNERMATLSDTLRANQQLMMKLAEAQVALGPALTRLGAPHQNDPDDVSRAHLRNIELLLARLLTESEQGRAQATTELRSDLKILTRTMAGMRDERAQAGMRDERVQADPHEESAPMTREERAKGIAALRSSTRT